MTTDLAKSAPTREESSSLRRLSQLLRPYSRQLGGSIGMQICLALVNMTVPVFIKLLLDEVFPNDNWKLLGLILAGMLGVYAARNFLFFLTKYTALAVGENVCFTLRNSLFEHLQQMNLQFYRRNKPGQMSSRVMDDSFVIQSFIQEDLPSLAQAGLTFICLVAIIYAVNWQLALASTIVLPLHLAAFFHFRRPIKQSSRVAQEQLSSVYGNMIEKFLGVEVVKGFTGEERENQTFQKAISVSRQSQLRSKTHHISQKVVADLLVGVGTIGLLGFGAFQVMKPLNPMDKGTFIAFFTYVGMLYPTVIDLMSGFAKLTRATASVDRVFEMLEQQPLERSASAGVRPVVRGHIRFDNVSFRHSGGPPVLRSVNLEILPGQVCAITGPSGAGKSTLVSLVPRFIDADLGRIYLDGVDLRKFDLRHLRSSIGIAFQECFLFNSSILENLRYARPDASMDQIVEVAQRTGAHEFILKLPHGYQTVLGETGVSLSRGEKQRITLTRAMLKNPQVLILDEATASIDSVSEGQIIPAILEFMRGKTTLMITHRLELLKHADVVVQINEGRVVYQGPAESAIMELLVNEEEQPHRNPGPGEKRGGSGIWRALQVLALAAAMALAAGVASVPRGALAQDQPEAPAAAAEAPAEKPERQQPKGKPKAKPADAPPPPAATMPSAEQATGVLLPFADVTAAQMDDMLQVVVDQLRTQLGYQLATKEQAAHLPQAIDGLQELAVLARQQDGQLALLQLAYKTYPSQPVHLWIYGMTVTDGRIAGNGDLATIHNLVQQAMKAMQEQAKKLTAGELEARTLTLSYIEADRCLAVLKSLGYETVEYKKAGDSLGRAQIIDPAKPVDLARLPIVVAMPNTDVSNLVGGSAVTAGAFGQSATPSVASELPGATSSAPTMELMVLYHPTHPEQYAQLLQRIRSTIDVPARQILIEAMVLEISETGLDALGVSWALESPQGNLSSLLVGTLPTLSAQNNELPTLDIGLNNVLGEFRARIQALIREGKAEILSRPSVLTLDNRQASIRVGEDIPVATSAQGLTGGDKLAFDFRYIPIGILLNVRPRISADGQEVSMQIDGIVSAQVPGQDLVIRDTRVIGGAELARAPRISTRRVQTYSRIANNTPFIIGGLVSKDKTIEQDKVPLLGDIPLAGALFRSTRTNTLKREVIIVITPFVLPEGQVAGRNLPKDEDAFDSFGNQLFRDAYRIRAEDVFDLTFLRENRQLARSRILVHQLMGRNADLAQAYPFNQFVGERFPGEDILVARQMYEVVKRRGIDEQMDPAKLIFFEPDIQQTTGFDVRFLVPFLAKTFKAKLEGRPPEDLRPIFAAMKGQALALSYTKLPQVQLREALQQPVPQITLHPCPDQQTWSRLLWKLNQPDEQGNQRYTILLRDDKDLTRLQRAIVVKGAVELNASNRALTLANFSTGRLLLMPTIKRDKVYLVDQDAAKYFFFSEQYYPALQQKLDDAAVALEKQVQQLEAGEK